MDSLNIILILYIGLGVLLMSINSQQPNDGFDVIKNKINQVNADNCATQDVNDLYLPEDAVSHLINPTELLSTTTFPNRTDILHLYNVAQSRSFYWSFIHQANSLQPWTDNMFDSENLYYFLSTVADVSSSSFINASAIYFAPYSVPHEILPLYAPRTFRLNGNTLDSRDLGAIQLDSSFENYTNEFYKINEWYRLWLPDDVKSVKQNLYEKTTYQVTIRYVDNKNSTLVFFGPPGPDERIGPVKFTRPYFDCGRSNKWLISAVVPIIGLHPPEGQVNYNDYPKYIAISVVEMEFEKIDINQCPAGTSNSGPNRFVDTARCKKETTYCEPLSGFGLRRGGYQCHCKPGFRLPKHIGNPFMGEDLERASQEEYDNGFDCEKIESPQDLPINWDKAPLSLQDKYLNEYKEYRNPKTNAESLHAEQLNIDAVLNFIYEIKPSNCRNYNATDLVLPLGMSYGAKEFFETDARAAVRLANFISGFLQVSEPKGQGIANRSLTEDQMISETLAIIINNKLIRSAGTYWEPNAFSNRTLFAPFAYKEDVNTRRFKVDDVSRPNYSDEIYTEKPWYRELKKRWSANDIEQFLFKINIRDTNVDYSFVVGDLESGYWTQMYFDCGGLVNRWLITYAAPYFGWNKEHTNLEFKGAVAVSMDPLYLDINQCDQDAITPNAFKGTHKCDRKTTTCVPILGRQFYKGGYKCECVAGYEYPFNELITYFDGELVEAEFENLIQGKATRYDIQQCRLAGAGSYISPNITLFHMHTPDE